MNGGYGNFLTIFFDSFLDYHGNSYGQESKGQEVHFQRRASIF